MALSTEVTPTMQLRVKLLDDARQFLMANWKEKIYNERQAAALENRAPKTFTPPNIDKIMKVAEKFYKFAEASREEIPDEPVSP